MEAGPIKEKDHFKHMIKELEAEKVKADEKMKSLAGQLEALKKELEKEKNEKQQLLQEYRQYHERNLRFAQFLRETVSPRTTAINNDDSLPATQLSPEEE